jgi:uncharacterized protein
VTSVTDDEFKGTDICIANFHFMHIAGYIASALIGLSLGLIGGGGSILTVPVLVYLFGLSPLLATSYSLFVVGTTSLVGAVNSLQKGLVSLKTVGLFGVSSIFTVFVIRKIVLPSIPTHLFKIGQIEVTVSMLTMIFFALLMLFAAISMICNGQKDTMDRVEEKKLHIPKLLSYGVMIGLVTGLLGGWRIFTDSCPGFAGRPTDEGSNWDISTHYFAKLLNRLYGWAISMWIGAF